MTRSTWRRIRVADLVASGEAEVKTGPFGTQLHASDYVESGTPVINVRNIGFGGIRTDKLEYIADETVRRLSGHLLHPGDIVFGRKGAVERHVLIRDRQSKWFQGSDCLRLRLRTQRVLPQFLSYYLLTREHQTWMMQQCSHGATMASLNQDIVGRIEFSVPDPAGQESIASILSAYDDLIENNTRRIAILEEMVRRIYEEWFVRFRFPRHEGVRMIESELGLVPEGWRVEPLHRICTHVIRGVTPKYQDGSRRFVLNQKANRGHELLESEFKQLSDACVVPSEKFARFGDVLVNSLGEGTIGRVHFYSVQASEVAVDQHMTICRAPHPGLGRIIYQYLESPAGQERIQSVKTGATSMTMLNISALRQFQMAQPPIDVLAAFWRISEPIVRLGAMLRRKNANLRTTRDLLLPKLISGELDLSAMAESEAITA